MSRDVIFRSLEPAEQYGCEGDPERQKQKANGLNGQRGEFGNQVNCEPGENEKSGTHRQHELACFDRHHSSHDHEDDRAELEPEEERHDR